MKTWVTFTVEEGLNLDGVIHDMRVSYDQLAAPS